MPESTAFFLSEMFFRFAHVSFASDISLHTSALKCAYGLYTLFPPRYFSMSDMFQNHVDLLQLWIVDDLQETDDVWMSDLLENGNLSFRLVLRGNSHLAKPSFLREALYDFNGHIIARLQAACQFDLAMLTSSNLVNDFVLVDEFSSRYEVLFDQCFVCPT